MQTLLLEQQQHCYIVHLILPFRAALPHRSSLLLVLREWPRIVRRERPHSTVLAVSEFSLVQKIPSTCHTLRGALMHPRLLLDPVCILRFRFCSGALLHRFIERTCSMQHIQTRCCGRRGLSLLTRGGTVSGEALSLMPAGMI
jgi:hypothetical protein